MNDPSFPRLVLMLLGRLGITEVVLNREDWDRIPDNSFLAVNETKDGILVQQITEEEANRINLTRSADERGWLN